MRSEVRKPLPLLPFSSGEIATIAHHHKDFVQQRMSRRRQLAIALCLVVRASTFQPKRHVQCAALGPLHVGQDVSTDTYAVLQRFPRIEAQSMVDDILLPRTEYGHRIHIGRESLEIGTGDQALSADDPRLDNTYGEFPLESLDRLLDLALQYVPDIDSKKHISFLDFGSGCGRLLMYVSLSRGSEYQPWRTTGIEILPLLCRETQHAMNVGIQSGFFEAKCDPNSHRRNVVRSCCGSVEDFKDAMASADIVFAYSTAFPAKRFSPEVGATILDPEWNGLFETCSPDSLVITTDRALDPLQGWKILDRLEVDNKEVFGSTGYIHRKVLGQTEK